MSTRGLVSVIKDKQYRYARYNHWDSYPSSLGKSVCNLIADIDGSNQWDDLSNNVCKLTFKPDGKRSYELNVIDELMGVLDGTILVTEDASEFSKDHLFCEWHYKIDLDQKKLFVYASGKLVFENQLSEINPDSWRIMEKSRR